MNNAIYTSSVFVGERFRNQQVMLVLEGAYMAKSRIRVWYGDKLSGTAWAEENDVLGYVGRSTGQVKIPLLVHNSRSIGGDGILQDCIVRIDSVTNRGQPLYQHQTFSTGFWQVLGFDLFHNGEIWARFKTTSAAVRYMEFMQGMRYAK
mgnify:CR=1 FL=1